MTYKEKMEKEHPHVDSNFVLFSCPGHYMEDGPINETCPNACGKNIRCYECWNQEIPDVTPAPVPGTEIPDQESPEKTGVKQLADRFKALYIAFRDEGLNDHEAVEITKIVIAAEVQNGHPVL